MTNNPIEHAELKHQRSVINASRSGKLWSFLAFLMIGPALMISMVFFLMFTLLRVYNDQLWTNWMEVDLMLYGLLMLVMMNLFMYPVVMLISFRLAANSINREKANHTWQVLQLTDISARQLVLGKWRASLRALSSDFVLVGLMRVGLVACWLEIFPVGPVLKPSFAPLDISLITLLVLGFTFVDTLMNSALALLVALINVPSSITFPIFAGLRALMVCFWLWWVWNTVNIIIYRTYGYKGISYLEFGVGGVILYLGMVFAVLRLAELAVVRSSNVSPTGKTAM